MLSNIILQYFNYIAFVGKESEEDVQTHILILA